MRVARHVFSACSVTSDSARKVMIPPARCSAFCLRDLELPNAKKIVAQVIAASQRRFGVCWAIFAGKT